ncbi:hypothetical protein HGRIS_012653 [Hohenbuehelia grisea]|uniref:Uncharacterized protein n=1 Tax=Hohenbuehelia grisea TaxID=104357 RepID=A0ABR3ISX3_9AGAR
MDDPLSLDIKSLRNAVAQYQSEAHGLSVKLQRHTLQNSQEAERVQLLEYENGLLRTEVESLRLAELPDSQQQQIHQMTLSMRVLSSKLSLTEDALLARTTELAEATSASDKATAQAASAYALAAQVRYREEEVKVRERELERRLLAAEEERKMAELAVSEYADFVRSLETRPEPGKSPPSLALQASSSSGSNSSQTTLVSNLSEGKSGLHKLLSEFNTSTDKLHEEITRLETELETLNARYDAQIKSGQQASAQTARARFELDKHLLDDNTAAKMVSRYMSFSQSQIISLQSRIDALKSRHDATLATLSAQLASTRRQLDASQRSEETLRGALDALGADLLREASGRRREVGVRVRMLVREERICERVRRWATRVQTLSNGSETSSEGDFIQLPHAALKKALAEAADIVSHLDGHAPDDDQLQGHAARLLVAQSSVDALGQELECELARRMELEKHLVDAELHLGMNTTHTDLHHVESEDKDEGFPLSQASEPTTTSDSDPIRSGEISQPPSQATSVPPGRQENHTNSLPLTASPSHEAQGQSNLASPPQGGQASGLALRSKSDKDKAKGVRDGLAVASEDEQQDVGRDVVHSDVEAGSQERAVGVTQIEDLLATPTPIDNSNEPTVAENEKDHDNDFKSSVSQLSVATTSDTTAEVVSSSVPSSKESLQDADPEPLSADPIGHATPIEVNDTQQVEFVSEPASDIVSQALDEHSTTLQLLVPFVNGNAWAEAPLSSLTPLNETVTAVTPSEYSTSTHDTPSDELDTNGNITLTIPSQDIPSNPPHPLLADLLAAGKRYDTIQRAFLDCHLALQDLKTLISPSPAGSSTSPHPHPSVLQVALERLDDYTEDARVELEIRIADEALLARGYETLLTIPTALDAAVMTPSPTTTRGFDIPSQNMASVRSRSMSLLPDGTSVEAEIQAFASGTDPAVVKALQSFEDKLENVRHDIAIIKRVAHEEELSGTPAHELVSPISPPPSSSSSSSWTSWIRGSPTSPGTQQPAPTFGSIMTTPSLRHSSSRSTLNSSRRTSDAQQTTLGVGWPSTSPPSARASADPLAALGLKVPMPVYAFGVRKEGMVSRKPEDGFRARSISGVYMLGLGARSSSAAFGPPGSPLRRPSHSLAAGAVAGGGQRSRISQDELTSGTGSDDDVE